MTTELAHAETRLAELTAKSARANAKCITYGNQYQSLRDTDTAEEATAHRRYQIWQTKSIAAEYGVWMCKETIRNLKAGRI